MHTIPRPLRQRRILLVDDDDITCDLLSHLLQRAGHVTRVAGTAEAALAAVAESEPDLALLDICMPGMSGVDLAQRLQAETSVPFMFLSGNKDPELIRQAAEYGAVGYLAKPFEPAQIAPAVEAALARADEIRELRRSEANLAAALASGRETSMAVGLLMAKFQTDRNTAFEVLRDFARAHRTKINEVAQDLLAAEEKLNVFRNMINAARPKDGK